MSLAHLFISCSVYHQLVHENPDLSRQELQIINRPLWNHAEKVSDYKSQSDTKKL